MRDSLFLRPKPGKMHQKYFVSHNSRQDMTSKQGQDERRGGSPLVYDHGRAPHHRCRTRSRRHASGPRGIA